MKPHESMIQLRTVTRSPLVPSSTHQLSAVPIIFFFRLQPTPLPNFFRPAEIDGFGTLNRFFLALIGMMAMSMTMVDDDGG